MKNLNILKKFRNQGLVFILIFTTFSLGGCTAFDSLSFLNNDEYQSSVPSRQSDAESDKPPITDEATETIKEPAVKPVLDLSGQDLERIPDYVFERNNLEILDVSDNRLNGAIQAEIRQLNRLKILRAKNNLMTGVPAEIGQLENLETLDLSNNLLTGLPMELGNLKKLKTLNLSGNDYSTADLEIIRRNLPENINIIL